MKLFVELALCSPLFAVAVMSALVAEKKKK